MVGYSLGTFVTIKYLVPPTTEIKVGKIKLKGDNSTLAPSIAITPDEDSPSPREVRKAERKEKKDIRAQNRAIKKASRKRNRDGG